MAHLVWDFSGRFYRSHQIVEPELLFGDFEEVGKNLVQSEENGMDTSENLI